MLNTSKGGFQLGSSALTISSVAANSSSYTTITLIPATGCYTRINISGQTTTHVTDYRLVHSVVSETSGFDMPSTTYLDQVLKNITLVTGKRAHTFALQARQSTVTTGFSAAVSVKWISLG